VLNFSGVGADLLFIKIIFFFLRKREREAVAPLRATTFILVRGDPCSPLNRIGVLVPPSISSAESGKLHSLSLLFLKIKITFYK
jgi:hypothetical protein